MADEDRDEASPEQRAEAILNWEAELLLAVEGKTVSHWALRACGAAIRRHDLDIDCFRRLFRAFLCDTHKTRYESFEDLLAYCEDSANPVGRLVIQLLDPDVLADAAASEASDAICTGLQLVNHWQDVREDADRGRIYLPQSDLQRFGVDESSLLRGEDSPKFRALMAFEVSRARALLDRGDELLEKSHGRLRFETALFRRAGLAACSALKRTRYDVMHGPAHLGKSDRARIVLWSIKDALGAKARARAHARGLPSAPSTTPPEAS